MIVKLVWSLKIELINKILVVKKLKFIIELHKKNQN